MQTNNPLICIVGPTACGKTHLAVHLAYLLNAEIISADSRQVYKHMDIGTGKDLNEYIVNGTAVAYHLIDIVEAGYQYNVFEYQRDFYKAYEKISANNHLAICCGGSGMYVEAILKAYRLEKVPVDNEFRKQCIHKSDEELAEELAQYRALHNVSDTSDRNRLIRALEIETYYSSHSDASEHITYDYKIFYVDIERERLRANIAKRLEERLQNGMVDEVDRLLSQGISAENLKYYGLEYKYITLYLNHELSYTAMKNQLCIAIGQFAKRQQTWFNRMRRSGFEMVMVPYELTLQEKINLIISHLR